MNDDFMAENGTEYYTQKPDDDWLQKLREKSSKYNIPPGPQADISGSPEGLNKQNIQRISIGSILGAMGGLGGAGAGAGAEAASSAVKPGLFDNFMSAAKGGDVSKMGIGGNILSQFGVGRQSGPDLADPDTIMRDDFDEKVQRMQERMINNDKPVVATPGPQASVGQAPAGLNKQNIQSICCFIFAEAYYGDIPWYVRASRDFHSTPARVAGYKWMANWLVPGMKRFAAVRKAVYAAMIKPLTDDARFIMDGGTTPRPVFRYAWLNLWGALGRLTGVPISYGACTGTKWWVGKLQIEAWTIPAGVVVPKHTHAEFSSVIVQYAGVGAIYRAGKARLSSRFTPYHIPAGVEHAVAASASSYKFLNFQLWRSAPTSAAVDFHTI